MSDDKWIEQVPAPYAGKKGFAEANWESERTAVVQVIEAINESGIVMVPIVGEVD